MTITEQEQYQALIDDCQTLSLEAFSLNDISKAIQNTLPRLSATFTDTLRLMTRWDYSRPEVLSVSALRLKAKQLDYLEMDDISVPVPVGFQGKLSKYIEHCQKTTYIEMVALNNTALPYIAESIAKYINEPELFNERFVSTLADKSDDPIRKLVSEESAFFITRNRVSDRAYTDVFDSNTDMVEACILLNDINNNRWANANPKDIHRHVTNISGVATTLLNNIQAMETPPNKEHVAAIAYALESAARWVEWYSVSVARLLETTAAMKRMEKKLLRL